METALNTTTTNTNTITKENKDVWYFDSGCTQHMTNNLSKLVNLTTANTRVVGAIRKESDVVSVKGECVLKCRIDEEESVVRLKEVLHVPHLRRNLISIKNICEKGLSVEFKGERCVVIDDDKIVMMGKKDETGLYVVVEENEEGEEVNYTNTSKIQQWHERLGHLSLEQIKKLHQINNLEGLIDDDFKEKIECDVCERGKKAKKKFEKKNEVRTKEEERSFTQMFVDQSHQQHMEGTSIMFLSLMITQE